MKISFIFFSLLVDIFCNAQTPFDCGGSLRPDLMSGSYREGYDDVFHMQQLALLKAIRAAVLWKKQFLTVY